MERPDEARSGARGPGRAVPIPAPEPPSPQRIAAWREAYLHGILIATAFLPFDFLYPRGLALTLAARGGLIATLVACRWRLGAGPPERARRTVAIGAVAAALLTPLLVATSSGSDGHRFGFLLSVPFILLSLLPEVPRIAAFAALSGAFAALVGAAILVAERQRFAHIAEWTLLATGVTAVTALGARRVHALSRRADDAVRERRAVVAQLEESERRRAASERLALLGRLAAGVGHEINNPLCAVKGNVACALEELERGGPATVAREALEEALAACDRIGWITADMRALATETAGPLVPCEVSAAIDDAVGRSRGRLPDVTLLTTVEPGLPSVRSEPRLLADAIGQLAAQAAQGAFARRGRSGERPTTIRITARRVADEVEIAIDDDGPPIPDHVLPRLFEPFASQGELRGAGLGLTLPLTRELAERGGGRVAASRRDGGNRFTVTLPVAAR